SVVSPIYDYYLVNPAQSTIGTFALNLLVLALRERARDAGKFDVDYSSVIQVETPTTFIGYEQLEEDGVTIDALYQDGNPADSLTEGMEGVVV
ncbi:hypothetical protein R0K04_23865, partial [Pseudoalteromonas sp. SIMBA_153]